MGDVLVFILALAFSVDTVKVEIRWWQPEFSPTKNDAFYREILWGISVVLWGIFYAIK